MFTIGQLSKQTGLSRSTLLYYERIKLLLPFERTKAGYRLYSLKNAERLKRMSLYKTAGLSLERIKDLLDDEQASLSQVLEQRLAHLNQEIKQLREQQRIVINLLGNTQQLSQTRILNKSIWTELLKKAGLDEQGVRRWHEAFEQNMPEAHQDFLEALRLEPDEIKKIRGL